LTHLITGLDPAEKGRRPPMDRARSLAASLAASVLRRHGNLLSNIARGLIT
jgi:hypothetical protein